jgi:hypothetical protein
MSEPRYWRIRMKYGAEEELTGEAWERDEVGIWYGAWGAREWPAALAADDPLQQLSRVNRQSEVAWDMPGNFFSPVKRFVSIENRDWVLVYVDHALALAQVCSEMRSSAKHPPAADAAIKAHVDSVKWMQLCLRVWISKEVHKLRYK